MDYDIEWTDPALQSLEEILTYIAQDNRMAADRLRLRIDKNIKLLRKLPLLGAA